jgi:hypothetical protein
MLEPKIEPQCTEQPLPLFRPEALAAQQQKFYGEILLIRPLSLTLFVWLGIGLASAVIGFLLLGHYTERIRVSGIILSGQSANSSNNSTSSQANLYVPERAVGFVHPGESVVLQSPARREAAVVTEISKSALSAEAISTEAGLSVAEPMYKVLLVLPAEAAQNGARVEAQIPLKREPLLRWLFRPNDSSTRRQIGSSDHRVIGSSEKPLQAAK